MDRFALDASRETDPTPPASGWQPPAFEVISLCCEITAYAPDDEPLF
ncbi:MAG: hypothetical protein R3263_11520 [Myxococcota bacterium]|nr:hypothetical protein [Myxococcota bacterium]